jgi:ABC-2 type transport system ATP-binding protein
MIAVEDLRKTYGGFPAVVSSSFEVERGEIFGVVGPNGAGKTTTLKMLAGLVEPTSGTASIAGRPAGAEATRQELGFLPEESPLYEDMTARSYLHFFADLYDVASDAAEERIEGTLDRLELEHRDRRLGDVSKGMKRKVAIARSLVNDPEVLIYDEPASGLDPLTTNYVLEFTKELSRAGKTVVFSAHNLYHVESVCDRVIIMNRGEVIARGTVPEIREAHGVTEYRVYTTVPVADATPAGIREAPATPETSTPTEGRTMTNGEGTVDPDGESGVADSGHRSGVTGTAQGGADADAGAGADGDVDGDGDGDVDVGGDKDRDGAGHAGPSAGHAATAGTGSGKGDPDRYVTVVESMDEVDRIRSAAQTAGGEVVDIRTREPSLEDIFLELAAEAPDDDARAEATR